MLPIDIGRYLRWHNAMGSFYDVLQYYLAEHGVLNLTDWTLDKIPGIDVFLDALQAKRMGARQGLKELHVYDPLYMKIQGVSSKRSSLCVRDLRAKLRLDLEKRLFRLCYMWP